MPNYCFNRMVMEHENMTEIWDAWKGKDGFSLNAIIPTPDHIYQGNLGPNEREKYGKNNWYDWSLEHWGTKWDCEIHEVDISEGSLEITFETAWTCPIPVFEAIAKQYPDCRLEVHWEEWGCENVGRLIYDDNEWYVHVMTPVSLDDVRPWHPEKKITVKEAIPTELPMYVN